MKRIVISFLLGILAAFGFEHYIIKTALKNDGISTATAAGCRAFLIYILNGNDITRPYQHVDYVRTYWGGAKKND